MKGPQMSLFVSIILSSLLGMIAGFIVAFRFLVDVADHRIGSASRQRLIDSRSRRRGKLGSQALNR